MKPRSLARFLIGSWILFETSILGLIGLFAAKASIILAIPFVFIEMIMIFNLTLLPEKGREKIRAKTGQEISDNFINWFTLFNSLWIIWISIIVSPFLNTF